jgi:dTDP-4-amino-4,6-dideoxygalactose transaminase
VFEARDSYRGLRLPETERAAREVLSLPVHPGLTADERDQVAREVNAAC